jgi:hypothetical protein
MECYSLKRSTKRSNAGGARESQGRALAGLLLSNQILKQLMGQCLVGYPRADLGGLPAVGGRDGQNLAVDDEGP